MSMDKGQQSQEAFYNNNCHHSTFYNQFEAKTLHCWLQTIKGHLE